MEKLYIIIPAYNEEANIKSVIESWYKIIEEIGKESKLVIIDDGSKDRTYEIIKECAKNKPNLRVVTKENGGHGETVLYGYKYAIQNNAEYVFQTDSDGQTVPEEFWKFWQEKDNYDMVIGNRNKRKDGISRIIVTKTLKLSIKLCFHVNVTDANTPFRIMKVETLKKYINKVPEKFNLTNVLLSVIYEKEKLKVKYIPITFEKRQGGINSINIRKICKIGMHAISDFRRLNKELA